METSKIEIICVSDNSYIQHLAVMTVSLFENNSDIKFNINLISVEISLENLKKYKSLFLNGNSLNIIHKDNSMFKDFIAKNHISKAAYHKILIPEFFTKLNRALVIDCDIIVMGKLVDLWNMNLEGKYLAAVQNVNNNYNDLSFNSGVMLLDMEKIRYNNLSIKMFDYLQANSSKEILHDQAGYNLIIGENWKKIPLKWNLQSNVFIASEKNIGYSKQEIKDSKKSPLIVHFSSRIKPWDYASKNKFKNHYYNYLLKTPWKSFVSKPKKTSDYFVKFFLPLIPFKMFKYLGKINRIINNWKRNEG